MHFNVFTHLQDMQALVGTAKCLIVGEATGVYGLDYGLKIMCWLYSILLFDIVQSCQRILSIGATKYTSILPREGREKRQHHPRRRRAGVFTEVLLTGGRSYIQNGKN